MQLNKWLYIFAYFLLASCATATKSPAQTFDDNFPPEDKKHPKTEQFRLDSRKMFLEMLSKNYSSRVTRKVGQKLIPTIRKNIISYRKKEEALYLRNASLEIEDRAKSKIGYYLTNPTKGVQDYKSGALSEYIAGSEALLKYPLNNNDKSYLITKGIKSIIVNAILPALESKSPEEGYKFLEEKNVRNLFNTQEYSQWMRKMK